MVEIDMRDLHNLYPEAAREIVRLRAEIDRLERENAFLKEDAKRVLMLEEKPKPSSIYEFWGVDLEGPSVPPIHLD